MKAIHVVDLSRGDPFGANGLFKAVLELVMAQNRSADVHLIFRGAWPAARPIPEGVKAEGGRFLKCVRALRALTRDGGVIHVHSVWSPVILLSLLLSRSRCRFVLSPHGVFASEALRYSAFKKRLFRPVLWLALKLFHQFQAASHKEVAEIGAIAGPVPVAIIPNAVSDPDRAAAKPRRRPVIGYLGRIHPIKGTLDLVRAWSELERDYPEWRLRIVGCSGDSAYLRAIEAAVARSRSIELAPPAEPGAAGRFLAQCEVVVVPSRSENFCYVVAEAYLAGTAVVTTDEVPWPQIESDEMGWRGPGGVEGIKCSLRAALAADGKERRRRGKRGRRFVRFAYEPARIADRSLAAYADIPGLGGASWPSSASDRWSGQAL